MTRPPPTTPLPVLLSIAGVADHLGVCTKTIRRIIAAGELPTTRVGSRIRITERDLGAYMARNRGWCPQVSNIGQLCPQSPHV